MINYDDLFRMAKIFLLNKHPITRELIEEAVDMVSKIDPMGVNREQMIREIEGDFSVSIADGAMLAEDSEHLQWLPEKRPTLEWEFWKRYRDYLTMQKGWPQPVVDKLDLLTDQVLDRIEDPERPGAWDRRGLVVGQVQSGKTSHYTGLICKAVDAGYNFIVVLAGVHDSLRSQTQLRLDEGFLGVDTQIERAWKKNTNKIGAGLLSSKSLHVAYLTNSAHKGDFNKTVANRIGIPLGSQIPILLVIKKNVHVLKNLITWLEHQANATDHHGNRFFSEFPILVLDDEADYASVNPNETVTGEDGIPIDEQVAAATNARIRQLLRMFARSVYVGYTATPFANIFIHPHATFSTKTSVKVGGETRDIIIGQDLFPKHFILNLPSPSNYIGPVQVFGLGEESDGAISTQGLPITRNIDDYDKVESSEGNLNQEDKFPEKHNKNFIPKSLPPSLRHAIRVFVLTCATRAARGQGTEHNSMLVHMTRFVLVQGAIAELIRAELKGLQNRLIFGDGNRIDSVLEEFRTIWESDFIPTTSTVKTLLQDSRLEPLTWDEVEPLLKGAASKISVKEINGTAQDVLDYYGNPGGISVIAVGGDKLSRGLTLEGLSVSYYLRASKMYDTLMQMGRWFGYRPGYSDLCRLYTTDELMSWYRHITIASEELRADFDEMARAGDSSPMDFGLKVRTHPGGMVVTGAGKLRNYTKMRVSFSGRLMESYKISSERVHQHSNYLAVTRFVAGLGTPTEKISGHYMWRRISGDAMIEFLRELVGYPGMLDFAPERLADFIANLNEERELDQWSVCLMNIDGGRVIPIAGLSAGLSGRTLTFNPSEKLLEVGQRHIISQEHEWLDVGTEEKEIARRKWCDSKDFERWRKLNPEKDEPSTLSGKWARKVRSPRRGLLLVYLFEPDKEHLPQNQVDMPYVGYALSFPESPNGDKRAVSYVVNSTYAKEEFDDE